MHDELALDLLGAFLLLLLLGGGVVGEAQFLLVVDGQLLVLDLAVGLEDVVDDLLPPVRRRVPE